MEWYVFYGTGRVLHAAANVKNGDGWTLKPFPSEETAIDFAIKRVKEGLTVSAVGEIKSSGTAPKYRHADIAKMANSST
jgi:hypothetical protein